MGAGRNFWVSSLPEIHTLLLVLNNYLNRHAQRKASTGCVAPCALCLRGGARRPPAVQLPFAGVAPRGAARRQLAVVPTAARSQFPDVATVLEDHAAVLHDYSCQADAE